MASHQIWWKSDRTQEKCWTLSFPSSLQSPVKAGCLATRPPSTIAKERGEGYVRSSSGWAGKKGAVTSADSVVCHPPWQREMALTPIYKQPLCGQHHARETNTYIHIILTTLQGKHCNSNFQRQKLSQRGQFPGPNRRWVSGRTKIPKAMLLHNPTELSVAKYLHFKGSWRCPYFRRRS